MSDLAMTVAVGPSDRNSGMPRAVDCLGQLIVGGSGVWIWHCVPVLVDPLASLRIRLRSEANLGLEIAAGIALSLDFGAARATLVGELGAGWHERDLELNSATLMTCAEQGFDMSLALVLTSTDPMNAFVREAIDLIHARTEWSLLVCTPEEKRLLTQWGEER